MIQHLKLEDILQMERFFRMNLINALTGFKSVHLVGTQNNQGVNNLGIFNAVFHLGANPPLIGMIFRPLTIPRHTYENIKSSGHYTLNMVHASFVEMAHQTSAKYEAGTSEFEACGFQPVFKADFKAPFVEASPVKIGLSYVEEHHIAANDTIMVVGRVEHLFFPREILGEKGHLNLEKTGVVAGLGLDSYYELSKLGRYSYARPHEPTKKIQ